MGRFSWEAGVLGSRQRRRHSSGCATYQWVLCCKETVFPASNLRKTLDADLVQRSNTGSVAIVEPIYGDLEVPANQQWVRLPVRPVKLVT